MSKRWSNGWWVFLLCAVASCSHEDKVSRGIIKQPKMSALLMDMQLAGAYNDNYRPDTVLGSPITGRDQRLKVLYQQILELHHTDKETFLKSYHFYEENPDMMKDIYVRMEDIISRKSTQLDSINRPILPLPTELPKTLIPGKAKQDFFSIYQAITDSIHHQAGRVFNPNLLN